MGPRILTIDIETRPHVAHVWGLWQQNVGLNQIVETGSVICFAAKWLGNPKVVFYSDFHDGHVEMLKCAWELLDLADVVVSYNGKAFDVKHLQREFVLAGMTPPSPHHDIDLYSAVKNKFKFASNKLQHVATELGLGSKAETGGFDLWVDCMAGDAKAWRKMKRYNCLSPEHRVLGEDLTWRNLGDCKVGDVILGFDEERVHASGRRYRRAIVESHRTVEADLFRVTLSSGKTFDTTADHKWLTARRRTHNGEVTARGWAWVETADLLSVGPNLIVPRLMDEWQEDSSRDAGWLAGMFDGEGSLHMRVNPGQQSAGGPAISASQKPGVEADRIASLTWKFSGVEPGVYVRGPRAGELGKLPNVRINVKGSLAERLRFLGTVRPERLIDSLDMDDLGRMEARGSFDSVVSVEPIGRGAVVVMATSTGTFIAEGYPMHNCQDVVLTEQLYERIRAWVPRHPNLALYSDEKVACPKCGSTDLQMRGQRVTGTGTYQQYMCNQCGAWSRTAKRLSTTDLREA